MRKWVIGLEGILIITLPSIPAMPLAESSKVAYRTNPNPLEYPETLSVTTLAVINQSDS